MAIRVVEFSSGGTKLERFLPKNQHTLRKLLNFENWVNGVSEVFKNQSFKSKLFSSSVFLILYPPFENYTTHIAIEGNVDPEKVR